MRRRTLIALLALALPAAASAEPLYGTWRADRALTLEERERATGLSFEPEPARERASARRITFEQDRSWIETGASRSEAPPLRILRETVYPEITAYDVELWNEAAQQMARRRVVLKDDLLYVPTEEGFHEVFRRETAPAAPSFDDIELPPRPDGR